MKVKDDDDGIGFKMPDNCDLPDEIIQEKLPPPTYAIIRPDSPTSDNFENRENRENRDNRETETIDDIETVDVEMSDFNDILEFFEKGMKINDFSSAATYNIFRQINVFTKES